MVRTLTVALVCFCIAIAANGQDADGLLGGAPAKEADGKTTAPRVREVVALRHMPAADLTKSLSMMLRGDGELDVLIVPEMISNSLLLSGPDRDVKQALALIDRLDRAPKMVNISVTIAEVKGDAIDLGGPAADVLKKVDQLETDGKLSVLNRISLTTIDNQSAYIQLGQQRPTVTARTRTGLGGLSSSSTRAVGTIVKATPRINGDNSVVMKLDIEKSWLVDDDTFTATSQSTVTVPDGRVVVVGSTAASANDETKQLLLLVGTDIISTE